MLSIEHKIKKLKLKEVSYTYIRIPFAANDKQDLQVTCSLKVQGMGVFVITPDRWLEKNGCLCRPPNRSSFKSISGHNRSSTKSKYLLNFPSSILLAAQIVFISSECESHL